jgi:hypothetical protein
MTMKGKNVEEETTKAFLDMIVEESTRTRTEDVPQKKRRIKIVMGLFSKHPRQKRRNRIQISKNVVTDEELQAKAECQRGQRCQSGNYCFY